MKIANYDTNLTDAQWTYLKPLLPKPAKRGRPPVDRRRIMDAILYLAKCGCPWRYLPANFPHWKTVYHVFGQWIANHQWAVLNDVLRVLVRKANGKRSRPTAAILDSQSVKSDGHGGRVGYDAGKRIKGRKRHLLVDTLGLVLGVTVTPANTTERDGAQLLWAGFWGAWFDPQSFMIFRQALRVRRVSYILIQCFQAFNHAHSCNSNGRRDAGHDSQNGRDQ